MSSRTGRLRYGPIALHVQKLTVFPLVDDACKPSFLGHALVHLMIGWNCGRGRLLGGYRYFVRIVSRTAVKRVRKDCLVRRECVL